MKGPIRFDGQVAIVTGAGSGIGRGFALELAERGARVLVNDCGEGSVGADRPAERVAAEIVAAGGDAAADTTAVGSSAAAAAIAGAAIAAFGRIDILVNNAGICITGKFEALDDFAAENVIRTNLLGPYALMRACWDPMRASGGGRVLNISSNASMGIGSNAPYAMSKSGLLGLSLDAAVDGLEAGIWVNAMLPTAFTQMTERIPDPAFVAWYRRCFPVEAAVRPMLYLLSEQSSVTGQIFSSGGGRVARIAFVKGRGALDTAMTPEGARARIEDITGFETPAILCSQADDSRQYALDFPRADGEAGLSLDAVRRTE